MAFPCTLRGAASSIAQLAIRALGNRIIHSSSVFDPLKNGFLLREFYWRKTFIPTTHFSSYAGKSSSDRNLLQIIYSEIRCAQESVDHDSVKEVPDGFPFEIQDNPGERTVSLRTVYQGETIILEAHMLDFVGEKDNHDDNEGNENEHENAEEGDESSIAMVVSISKGHGTCLEFGCSAYRDNIAIDSLIVKKADAFEDQDAYEGPEFLNLDKNLQEALHKYLEIRGIKLSTTNFLHEYMIKKESREYTMWLKNVKKFIEKEFTPTYLRNGFTELSDGFMPEYLPFGREDK